jgi:Flp pilus assembly protein TadG
MRLPSGCFTNSRVPRRGSGSLLANAPSREASASGRRRRLSQNGNAMLEAALALPPLFMILFATIDFSVALLVQNTITSAVREGVRYAVTGQTLNGLGQNASIISVIESDSLGFLNTSNQNLISITYYNPTTLQVVTGVNSNAPGNIVQVQVNGLSWAWMVPYGRSATPLSISATSSDIIEQNDTGIPPSL